MRLTSYSDYSLRVLMLLAIKPDHFGTITEVAERYDISRNHVMKVVHGLSQRGYINTVRGKYGGMYLRHPPEYINLGELIRKTEHDFALVECFGPNNRCVITPVCRLRHVIYEALRAFHEVLDRYTLADLIVEDSEMRSLLGIEAAPVEWGPARINDA